MFTIHRTTTKVRCLAAKKAQNHTMSN